MRQLILMFVALALVGCAPGGGTQSPTPTPTPTPSAVAPGASSLVSPFIWDAEGITKPELADVVDQAATPQALSTWLQAHVEWRDDYDTQHFLSPSETFEAKRTVCTGFARIWALWANRHGIKPYFLAFWSQASGHAVCLIKRDGRWEMGSNQYFYADNFDPTGDGLTSAMANAAAAFYGPNWVKVQLYHETGQVAQEIVNTQASPAPLAPGAQGRNVFTIRR